MCRSLFRFFLLETMVNCCLPLSLREATFSAYVRLRVRGVLLITSTGESHPSPVPMSLVFGMFVSYDFRFEPR